MSACFRTYRWALATAVLMAWAFPTFHWYPLAWLGLVPLLADTRSSPWKESAVRFFVAGWVFHTIVLQWLIGNIFWAGGWAILGQQGVCLALSGYWAVMGVVWCRMNARLPAAVLAPAFAVSWIAMEWLQARLFTGFGWAAFGYTQGPDVWLAQLASLGGVGVVTGVLVGFNVYVCQLCSKSICRTRGMVAAAGLFVIAHVVGYALYVPPASRASEETFQAGIYQSNYAQQMKWDPAFQETMLDMAVAQSTAVSAHEEVDLFVWPEALIMTDFRSPRILQKLETFVADTGVPLFTGSSRRDGDSGRAYNAGALFVPDGAPEIYDKMKLAPFGEYIPFESWLSFARGLGAGGGTSPGDEPRVLAAGGRRFGPLICFEVLFAPLADERRALGADFLVVVTNLGWFGGSNVLSQELEIARFRAIENRLPLVQAANTGVSAVIDPWGRIDVIDGAVTTSGRYLTWNEPPDRTEAMMQRRVGALPVPEAAELPLPGSVRWFGRLATVLGVMLVAGVFWLPPRARDDAAG